MKDALYVALCGLILGILIVGISCGIIVVVNLLPHWTFIPLLVLCGIVFLVAVGLFAWATIKDSEDVRDLHHLD